MAATSALAFILCFSLALFGVEMTIAPSWTFCIDLGGRQTGAISATMNMFGNFGSATSAVLFPYFKDHVTMPFFAPTAGSANAFFVFAAGLNALAMIAWTGMNPQRKPKLSLSKQAIRFRGVVLCSIAMVVLIVLYACKIFIVK